MKDNIKSRPQWTVSSVMRRLVSIPRAGLRQQGIGNFLFAVVAALLTVCIIWGPTVSSSTKNVAQTARINPQATNEFFSRPALKDLSTSGDADAAESFKKDEDSDIADESEGEEENRDLFVKPAGTTVPEKDEFRIQEKKKKSMPVKADEEKFQKRTINVEAEEEEEEDFERNRVIIKENHAKKPVADDKPQSLMENSGKKWDTASFRFNPQYSDWDKQRAALLKKNPNHPRAGRKSTVMLVTSSSPQPCTRTIGNYVHIMSTKNKVDYARLHEIPFYYDMSNVDPKFDGMWNEIALLRMLMVNHPEVDWFWWMDMEAWITDMAFEIPFDKYASDNKNLFLYGDTKILYDEKSWVGISTGDFGIRNCQWSLDLLDAWASLGIKEIREESGQFLTQNLPGRPEDFPADVQSALAYLLVFENKKWSPKVALEKSYALSGNWVSYTAQYEELMAKYHPGFGDDRWPFCVDFAGCQECSNATTEDSWETCYNQMLRTYDFAGSQVLQTMGFKLVGKLGGGAQVVPLRGEQPEPEEGKLYHIYPNVSDWDKQRAAYLKKSKNRLDRKGSKPRVLLVSGQGAKECPDVRGTHFYLKALKNKIDYARMHDMDFYYNMDNLDKELTGWWMKIPIIRAMMLAHPESEWIWWVDSDAVFTDMVFEPPFESYKGTNLILWGDEEGVFKEKSFYAINAGILIIRNCQWSLDFFDTLIPMGPQSTRDEYGAMLSKFVTKRPVPMQSDDQAAIVYMLTTEKEKWAPKTFFENNYILSGSWPSITKDFEKLMAEHKPGSGDWRCPLITHFAGCQPCSRREWSNYDTDECYKQMERSVHFADNQIVHAYDLEHQSLGTWELQSVSSAASAKTQKR
ncbi:hypothetical protein R1flu_006305 [Riccia fluitans]|uniref:Uncharacterized protein n=1 Tax=Riccia fluitans TaxID=41844 RepID=A0ABD1YVM7_9MARC